MKMISVTATGASAPTSLTRSVLIFDLAPVSGANQGRTGVSYTFSADLSPEATSLPVKYVWQASGLTDVVHNNQSTTDSASFLWTTPGTKTVTVTATVAGQSVTKSRTISIAEVEPSGYQVYLPLVVSATP